MNDWQKFLDFAQKPLFFFFLMEKVSFTMGLKGIPRLWEIGIDKEFQARESSQTLMSKMCGEQEERDGH